MRTLQLRTVFFVAICGLSWAAFLTPRDTPGLSESSVYAVHAAPGVPVRSVASWASTGLTTGRVCVHFQVIKPITLTHAGAFDSYADGFSGQLVWSLFSTAPSSGLVAGPVVFNSSAVLTDPNPDSAAQTYPSGKFMFQPLDTTVVIQPPDDSAHEFAACVQGFSDATNDTFGGFGTLNFNDKVHLASGALTPYGYQLLGFLGTSSQLAASPVPTCMSGGVLDYSVPHCARSLAGASFIYEPVVEFSSHRAPGGPTATGVDAHATLHAVVLSTPKSVKVTALGLVDFPAFVASCNGTIVELRQLRPLFESSAFWPTLATVVVTTDSAPDANGIRRLELPVALPISSDTRILALTRYPSACTNVDLARLTGAFNGADGLLEFVQYVRLGPSEAPTAGDTLSPALARAVVFAERNTYPDTGITLTLQKQLQQLPERPFAVGPDENFYFSYNGDVYVYSPAFELINRFSIGYQGNASALTDKTPPFVDRLGNVYAYAGFANNRTYIKQFTAAGVLLNTLSINVALYSRMTSANALGKIQTDVNNYVYSPAFQHRIFTWFFSVGSPTAPGPYTLTSAGDGSSFFNLFPNGLLPPGYVPFDAIHIDVLGSDYGLLYTGSFRLQTYDLFSFKWNLFGPAIFGQVFDITGNEFGHIFVAELWAGKTTMLNKAGDVLAVLPVASGQLHTLGNQLYLTGLDSKISIYTVDCLAGYYGTSCQHVCDSCDSLGGTCAGGLLGNGQCVCKPGYTGSRCSVNDGREEPHYRISASTLANWHPVDVAVNNDLGLLYVIQFTQDVTSVNVINKSGTVLGTFGSSFDSASAMTNAIAIEYIPTTQSVMLLNSMGQSTMFNVTGGPDVTNSIDPACDNVLNGVIAMTYSQFDDMLYVLCGNVVSFRRSNESTWTALPGNGIYAALDTADTGSALSQLAADPDTGILYGRSSDSIVAFKNGTWQMFAEPQFDPLQNIPLVGGLCVGHGYVFMVHTAQKQVQAFSTTSGVPHREPDEKFGSLYSIPQSSIIHMMTPGGCSIDTSGTLYVADRSLRQVIAINRTHNCRPDFWGPQCVECGCPSHADCADGLEGDGACTCHTLWTGEQCDICIPGFEPSHDRETCLQCGLGLAGNGTAPCYLCPPGTYADGRGYDHCIDCPAGHYQNETGSASCKLADPGHHVPVARSTEQFACAPGYFSSRSGAPVCTLCNPGEFTEGFAASQCYRVSVGYEAPSYGTNISGFICPPGTFAPVNGSATCTPCPLEEYNDQPGGTNCFPCPALSSSLPIAATNNVSGVKCSCKDGYYMSEDNECVLCPEGGVCELGIDPYAMEEFWPSAQSSLLFYDCPYGGACQRRGACNDGYGGPVCAICAQSFFLDGEQCTACPTTSQGGMVALAVIVILFLVGIAAAKITRDVHKAMHENDEPVQNTGDAAAGAGANAAQQQTTNDPQGDARPPSTQAAATQVVPVVTPVFRFNSSKVGPAPDSLFSPVGQNNGAPSLRRRVSAPNSPARHDIDEPDFFSPRQPASVDDAAFVAATAPAAKAAGSGTVSVRPFAELPKGAQNGQEPPPPEEEEEAGVGVDEANELYDDFAGVADTGNIKVLVGYLQVLSIMPEVFNVDWPSPFTAVSSAFSFIDISFFTLTSLAACSMGTTEHFFIGDFLLKLIGPLVLVGVFYAALRLAAIGYKMYVKADLDLVTMHERFINSLLFLSAILYTQISTNVIQMFRCRNIDGVDYLQSDYTTQCWTSYHASWAAFAAIGILMYPLGIPAFHIFVLHRYKRMIRENTAFDKMVQLSDQRHKEAKAFLSQHGIASITTDSPLLTDPLVSAAWKLAPDEEPVRRDWFPIRYECDSVDLLSNESNGVFFDEASFLPDQEPGHRELREQLSRRFGQIYGDFVWQCTWWGVFDTLRKLILTSALMFLEEGSSLQITLGLATNIAALTMHFRYLPCASLLTNWITSVALVVESANFLMGLFLKGLESETDTDSLVVFGTVILMLANSGMLAFSLGIFIYRVVIATRLVIAWIKKLQRERLAAQQANAVTSPADPAAKAASLPQESNATETAWRWKAQQSEANDVSLTRLSGQSDDLL